MHDLVATLDALLTDDALRAMGMPAAIVPVMRGLMGEVFASMDRYMDLRVAGDEDGARRARRVADAAVAPHDTDAGGRGTLAAAVAQLFVVADRLAELRIAGDRAGMLELAGDCLAQSRAHFATDPARAAAFDAVVERTAERAFGKAD